MPFAHGLSDHRPVSFARRTSKYSSDSLRQMPSWVASHTSFPELTREYFNDLRHHAGSPGALAQLQLFKDAMWQAARDLTHIFKPGQRPKAAATEDRLSCSLSFVSALERRQSDHALAQVSRYPRLRSMYGHDIVGVLSPTGLMAMRDHAVELAQQNISERLEELRRLRSELLKFEIVSRKQQVFVRLQRLLPGRSSAIQAVIDQDGSVVSDPESMADVLSKHWGDVFSRTPTDRSLLET